MKILVLSKRQYMNKDLIDDRFGRFREIPLALAKKGHQVRGLCLSYDAKNEGWFEDRRVRWKSINAGRLKLFGLLRYIKEALSLGRHTEVIWACSDSIYGIIGCIIGKYYNIPVIFDLYDNYDQFLLARLPVIKQLYRWSIKHADAITILSYSYAEFIEKHHKRKTGIYFIEFAIPGDHFKPLDKKYCRNVLGLPYEAILIGTAGALFKSRGVDLLINSFMCLRYKYPELHLVLAGPADQSVKITNDSRIHYLGVLPHNSIPIFFNSLDIAFIGANKNQSKYCYPAKAPEIMACDIPLIAMKTGDMVEIFKDNPEWLFEDDDLISLINALENRLNDKRTSYSTQPTWFELGEKLEKIMLDFVGKGKKIVN